MVRDIYNAFVFNVGISLIIISLFYIIIIVWLNFYNEEKYLHIYLNSGNIYYFSCNDKKFLKDIMEVIEYCINHHYTNEVKIDFDNCKLYNSPITVGDKNEVN